MLQPADIYVDSINDVDILLAINLGFSVICCCLPTYRPILPKVALFAHARRLYLSLLSKMHTSAASTAKSESCSESQSGPKTQSRFHHYSNLDDEAADAMVLTRAARTFHPTVSYLAGRDFSTDSIKVKSTLEMV